MAKLLSFEVLERTLSSYEGTSALARDDNRDEEYRRLMLTLTNVMEGELTELQRECVRLYYYDGMTMQQVAETLGVQKPAVSKVLRRARRRIQQVLLYCYEERLR